MTILLLGLLGAGSPPLIIAEPQPAETVEIGRGVVVEKVARNGEGEKAGVKEGDVLLSWSRGDNKGDIQSPFDLVDIEIEQAPLGEVEIEGLRGGDRQTWSLGPSAWELTTRPNFSGQLSAGYREAEALARTAKPTDIIEASNRWKDLAQRYSGSQAPLLPVWLLFHSAQTLQEAKQWKEADSTYQSAVQDGSGLGSVVEGQLLEAWAKAYLQRSDWGDAEKHFRESLAKRGGLGVRKLAIAVSLNALGRMAGQRGDPETAERYVKQALGITKDLAPESLVTAACFEALGYVALLRGNLASAEDYNGQALRIREKLAPGSLDVAASLNNLGTIAQRQGDLTKAEDYHRQALTIKEKLAPGSFDLAASLANLGILADERGDSTRAILLDQQALAILEKLAPDSLGVAKVLNNLGNEFYEGGEFARARPYFLQALEIQKRLGSPDLSYAFDNLGSLAAAQEDLANAERYYRKSLEIRQKVSPTSIDVATVLDNLGYVAYLRRNLAEAETFYKQALAIQEKLAPNSLGHAEVTQSLGELAAKSGDTRKAEEYYLRALAIKKKLAPEGLSVASTLQALGELAYQLGDTVGARQYYRQALDIRQQLAPGSMLEAVSLASLAAVLRDEHQPDTAVQFYEQAVIALEKQSARLAGSEEVRSGFRANHSDIYRDYVDLLLGQRQRDRAFEISERSRARILLEMLTAAHLDIRKGADPSLLQQERSLRESISAKSDRRLRFIGKKDNEKEVATLTHEIEELERQYQDVEDRLQQNSPVYAALTQPKPLTNGEIQQLLGPDTLLLEYSLGEDHSHVFAVTRDSISVQELPKRADIEKLARRVLDLLAARDRSRAGTVQAQRKYRQVVAALSRMLLGPVSAYLSGKRLAVVADGALQYIPFAILPTPASAGTRSPVPLILDHEIVNLPSVSLLAVLRQQAQGRTPPPKAVAVLADPVFSQTDSRVIADKRRQGLVPAAAVAQPEGPDISPGSQDLTRSATELGMLAGGSEFPRLRFSRAEAEGILSLAPQGSSMEALDFQASRETATSPQLAQYRVVHFATHGIVNNVHPELSGLVFSLVDQQGKPENGFLELEDIYNLNLPVDLIVLSACDSGLGKEIRGEGLIGLTRGFMYAGASRVIASLWNVSDVATAALMKEFYRGLEKDGMTPAAALRHAQIWMWKQPEWRFPYYWAAFQLQGDWK